MEWRIEIFRSFQKNQVKEAVITNYASMLGRDDSRIIVTKNSEIIIQKLKP
jgi:hypothetical protein